MHREETLDIYYLHELDPMAILIKEEDVDRSHTKTRSLFRENVDAVGGVRVLGIEKSIWKA